jgi:hypothetical protein
MTYKNNTLLHTQANIDFVAQFKYPRTARVLEVGNEEGKIHLIWVDVDVSALLTATDGTGFGKAPIGTRITQYLVATPREYIKQTDSTWKTITPA